MSNNNNNNSDLLQKDIVMAVNVSGRGTAQSTLWIEFWPVPWGNSGYDDEW